MITQKTTRSPKPAQSPLSFRLLNLKIRDRQTGQVSARRLISVRSGDNTYSVVEGPRHYCCDCKGYQKHYAGTLRQCRHIRGAVEWLAAQEQATEKLIDQRHETGEAREARMAQARIDRERLW